jgi:hypothetical protein
MMLSFIPLNDNPLDRAPGLKTWIKSWAGESSEFLEPEGWFERGHDHRGGSVDSKGFWTPRLVKGTFIWTLPPAAAGVALEEFRKARLKRQRSTHVIVCPRLLTREWLKQLYKASDLVLSIPAGAADYWPLEMCEPLIIGLVFPFINRYPWQLRNTPKMFSMARTMRSLFEAKDVAAGNILRNFYWSVNGFEPCRKMWCGECYTTKPEVEFHIRTLSDEPGQNEPEGCGQSGEGLGKKKPKKGGLHQS